jgi:hypothetical protein
VDDGPNDEERRRLGLDTQITRRDNTWPVVQAAHRLRDGAYDASAFAAAGPEGYGYVAIGHSELNGAQHWGSALEYGKKAGERAASLS